MAHTDRPPPTAARPADLRALNIRRVLEVFLNHEDGPATTTQASISRETTLAPATVHGIVRTLVDAGILKSVDDDAQRGQVLTVSTRAGYVVGVDIGHTHVSIAAGDVSGRFIAGPTRHEVGIGPTRAINPTYIADLVASFVNSIDDIDGPGLALCIAMPAPVAPTAEAGPMLSGWEGPLLGSLQSRVDLPLLIDNDANLGAIAEHRFGAARGKSSSVFVKASSGIGAGIIIGGELWRGQSAFAGEIGHLTVTEGGGLCRCGNRGCLEVDMLADYQQVFDNHVPPSRQAFKTDYATQRLVDDAGFRLGRALAMLATVLDPEIIVIGGAWNRLGDYFIDPVRRGLTAYSMRPAGEREIVPSTFGAQSVITGATIAAADRAIEHLSSLHSG